MGSTSPAANPTGQRGADEVGALSPGTVCHWSQVYLRSSVGLLSSSFHHSSHYGIADFG